MKKTVLTLTLLILIGSAAAFSLSRSRAHTGEPTSTSQDGYYLTGHIVINKGNQQETLATWIKQGDHRGWRLDQFYLDKQGRITAQVRQWCIAGDGAFIQRSVGGAVETLGPCNLYPPNTTGAPAQHLGEAGVVRRAQRENVTVERIIAPRLGTQVKLTEIRPNGFTLIDEALSLRFQPVAPEVFIVPR